MDVSKLPKWAQSHIQDLERRAERSEQALAGYLDEQTESPFYIEDCIRGSKRYIQTHKITVCDNGIELDVILPGGVQGRTGIELNWHDVSSKFGSRVGVFPRASNCISLERMQEAAGDE